MAQEPAVISSNSTRSHAACSASAWALLIGVATVGVIVDLSSKSLAFAAVGDTTGSGGRSEMVLIEGVAKLRLAWNEGAVFGLGSGQQSFFITFTIAAMAVGLLIFAFRTTGTSRLAHAAIGIAMAGAIGNLHDRVRFSAVRDFIQLLPGHRLPNGLTWAGTNNPEMFPWVFNIADVLLAVGLLLAMRELRKLRAASAAPLKSPAAQVLCPVESDGLRESDRSVHRVSQLPRS